MKLKTKVKGGGLAAINHSQRLVVRTRVRAGGLTSINHNAVRA